MAQNPRRAVRKIKQSVSRIAESEPVIAITRGIERVGEAVSEHAPKAVRKAGRWLRDEAEDAFEAIPEIKRKVTRAVRRATNRGRRRAPRR